MTRTELDPATGDADLRQLFNQSVDAELGPRRAAPRFVPSPVPTGSTGSWRVPLLAASVLALVAGGTVLAIQHNRTSGPAQVAPASVALSNSPAPTSYHHGPDILAGVPEAATVAGVSVGPVSAADAKYVPALIEGPWQPGKVPAAGVAFTVRTKYVTTTPNPVQVATMEALDLASAQCPPAFLARPGHTYVISCTVVQRPGVNGRLRISLAGQDGAVNSGTFSVS